METAESISTGVGARIAAIPPDKRTCNWCPDHTPDGEPIGPECGKPATHVITWWFPGTSHSRWSFSCADHHSPPAIDPPMTHGWDYRVAPLLEVANDDDQAMELESRWVP